MQWSAILFDLDGTLLPMDQEVFTNGYFRELAKVLSPLGIAPKALVDAVWAGTKAMVCNTGERSNAEVFWARFTEASGQEAARFQPASNQFYIHEFHRARAYTGENPLAAEAIHLARRKARQVILATNPLFPLAGQATRLSWIGLRPEDFDLVTSYESDSYCKPNPQYYLSICERMSLSPQECLMIGNDESEDMYAATAAGMSGYLITDCRIPSAEHPWHGPQGTFPELLTFLRSL